VTSLFEALLCDANATGRHISPDLEWHGSYNRTLAGGDWMRDPRVYAVDPLMVGHAAGRSDTWGKAHRAGIFDRRVRWMDQHDGEEPLAARRASFPVPAATDQGRQRIKGGMGPNCCAYDHTRYKCEKTPRCSIDVPAFIIQLLRRPGALQIRESLRRQYRRRSCTIASDGLHFIDAVDASNLSQLRAHSAVPASLLESAPLSRSDRRRSRRLISKGELALTLSHLKAAQGAYRHLLRTGGTAALVLEEDVDLSPLDVYNRTLSEWAEAALGAGWLVASLGSTITRPPGWTLLADAVEPKEHPAYRRRSSSPLAADRNWSSPEAGLWGTFAVMYSIEGLRLLLDADGSETLSRMTATSVSDNYIHAVLRASSWIAVPPLVIVAAGEHDILDVNSSSTMGSHSRGRLHAEQGALRAISVMAAALPSGCGPSPPATGRSAAESVPSRAEQQERKRLQAKFGWDDAATAPFEELHVRSELARRNELAEKGRGACKVVVTEEQSQLACEYGVTYGCVDERTVWTRCRGRFRCGGQAHVTFHCGFPPGRPLYHCNCSA